MHRYATRGSRCGHHGYDQDTSRRRRLETGKRNSKTTPPRLIEKSALREMLGESGISNDTTILLYATTTTGLPPTLLAIERLRQQNVKLINGAERSGWEEKRPLTKEGRKGHPTIIAFPALTTHSAPSATTYSRCAGKKRGTRGWCARSTNSPARLSRLRHDRTAPARRHIPSAANIPWAQAATNMAHSNPRKR